MISGCDSPPPAQTEDLQIDGTSVEAYRTSHMAIMKSLEDRPPELVPFLKGYFAAKLSAQKSLETGDKKAGKNAEMLEKMEMQILNGLDIEEVIEYGQSFEDETGLSLLPSS
ncbi:hypothetical protein [Haloferula sp.]|uniref:hypothetical protein n=1 Tax=Haloferula sp. TaxID=2497595 RepID=UPI00329F30A2